MEKKEFHVVYIITKLELGGAQKVCLSLFEGLAQSGHTASLISGNDGILTSTVQHHPHFYVFPTFKREVSLKNFYQEIKNFIHLARHLKKMRIHYPNLIVHTHSTKAGLIGRWAAFFSGIQQRIHTVHGYAFHAHQNIFISLAVYVLELLTSFITTHFICVSSADVQTGVRFLPRFKNKYSIIRAAVNKQFYELQPPEIAYEEENITKGIFTIGTVACLKKQKNLTDLIRAFHYAHQKNPVLRLEIIGDGMLRPELEQLIQDYHLTSVVTLLGWKNSVAPLMLSWGAFALTSLWEGLPCALVEARLLKLPILAYNTGGIPDVIINGKNGFLYKQKDWKSLAEGMVAVSTNDELYRKLCGYHENLDDFRDQTMIAKHIELYQRLIE